MRRLNIWLSFSWQERRVLFYACLLLNAIRLALWLLPFKVLRQHLNKILSVWVRNPGAQTVPVDFIVRAVSTARVYTPGGAKCLAAALTTQALLNRYEHPHKLHIGVARGRVQILEAHAWVECNGQIVVGRLDDLDRFKVLSRAGAKG